MDLELERCNYRPRVWILFLPIIKVVKKKKKKRSDGHVMDLSKPLAGPLERRGEEVEGSLCCAVSVISTTDQPPNKERRVK